MNPFRLGGGLPQRRWLRLGLGILGLAMVVAVARRVDWPQFWAAFAGLDWLWIAFSFFLGGLAMSARALRLAWIFGDLRGYGSAWRATALGYLGKALLPLGGGELVKIGVLQKLLEVPGASAAAGTVLDRMLDLLGAALLVALLAAGGVSLQFRRGPLVAGLLVLAVLGLGTWLLLRLRRPAPGRVPNRLERLLEAVGSVLEALRRPGHLGRLLASQGAVTALDLAAIHVGLRAFAFGPGLPFLVSVKLAVLLMLGSVLPLLPGGAGPLQVACLLALQPAGVSAAGAFAYSILSQGTGLAFACLLGVVAALWPDRRLS